MEKPCDFKMISDKDYKTLQELKKFCAKKRITLQTSLANNNMIICFNRSRDWYYLNTNNSNRSWLITKSFEINV